MTTHFDSAEDVLIALAAEHRTIPHAALAAADVHRQDLVDLLLEVIDDVVDDPEGASEDELQVLSYAVYLLARWNETRALASVIELFSLPGDLLFDFLGDIPTQNGSAILAALSTGIGPLDELVRDRTANEYARSAALQAVAALALHDRVPMLKVQDYFGELIENGLERERNYVWDAICDLSVELAFASALPGLRRAFAAGWIDPQFISEAELEKLANQPTRADGLADRVDFRPITDVASSIAWWREWTPEFWAGVPATSGKVGRNHPCPCGSGKKYKKCHGA